MSYSRSPISKSSCKLGYADQMNAVTHWLDNSNIYGSGVQESNFIRTKKNGMIKSTVDETNSVWSNFFPILWTREHNRIAQSLKTLNDQLDDDALFFRARRILNAEYQHVIYNEWLPIIIGMN